MALSLKNCLSRSESKPDLRQGSEPHPLVLVMQVPCTLEEATKHKQPHWVPHSHSHLPDGPPQTRPHCLVSKANRITASSEGCPSAQEGARRTAGAESRLACHSGSGDVRIAVLSSTPAVTLFRACLLSQGWRAREEQGQDLVFRAPFSKTGSMQRRGQ